MLVTWSLVLVATLACVWRGTEASGNSGDEFQAIITRLYRNKYLPVKYDFSKHRYVVFEVKACFNARILLTCGGHDHYEVVIGTENRWRVPTRTLIARHAYGAWLKWVDKQWPLKYVYCNKFVKYWISWDYQGVLRVGDVNGPILTYHDRTRPTPKICAVSVSTGWRFTGMWKIYNPEFTPRQCCQQAGNEYCIVPKMTCTLFTQKNILQNGSETHLKHCPSGLKLNTNNCVCDHATSVNCTV